jgi:8-oxo-dGTP diphosphatase
MTEVNFFDPLFEPDDKLVYSVIAARFNNKWLFVRHNDRNTFEIAGGHIEEDETSFDAARRELMEETGAYEFRLECVGTYSVTKDGVTGYGRLYFAEISGIGSVPDNSEISETIFLDHLPDNLTYPDIQPLLFKKVNDYLKNREAV